MQGPSALALQEGEGPSALALPEREARTPPRIPIARGERSSTKSKEPLQGRQAPMRSRHTSSPPKLSSAVLAEDTSSRGDKAASQQLRSRLSSSLLSDGPEVFNISGSDSPARPDRSPRGVTVATPTVAVSAGVALQQGTFVQGFVTLPPAMDTTPAASLVASPRDIAREDSAPQALQSALSDCDCGVPEQVDAWSFEHWDSPETISPHSRSRSRSASKSSCFGSCSTAQPFEDSMRGVADTLHRAIADVDVMVQKALAHFTSWLSEEIAFARQGLEEESRTTKVALEAQAKELSSLRDKVLAGGAPGAQPGHFAAEPKSSGVFDARLVAEERRWRLQREEFQKDIEGKLQGSLDEQLCRIEKLEQQAKMSCGRVSKLQERTDDVMANAAKSQAQLQTLATAVESNQESPILTELRERSASFDARLAKHDCDLGKALATARQVEANVATTEQERLAELRRVCEKVEAQSADLADFERCLSSHQENCGTVLADLGDDIQQLRTSMADAATACDASISNVSWTLEERLENRMSDLAKLADSHTSALMGQVQEVQATCERKADSADLEASCETWRVWVDQVRESLRVWSQQAQQTFSADAQSLRGEAADQAAVLEEHVCDLRELKSWCEQVHIRERGLGHVILHLVENSSPEQMKMFEEALRIPKQSFLFEEVLS